MAKLVSKTYGDALFDFAMEQNRTDELMDEVLTVMGVLKENEEFEQILSHPEISKEKKLGVVESVFKGSVSDALTGFLRIVVNKGRYKDLSDIFAHFIAKVKEFKKIGVAEVVSAVPLQEDQKVKIEKKLLETTSYETMEIEYKVDAALIGGLVIRIGDRIIDSTLRSKLTKLTADLMKVSLESKKEGVQAS